MDLTVFAEEVAGDDPVTIAGDGTRGGAVAGVRCVHAPAGIDWLQADEMIVSCGAATRVDELDEALAKVGQQVALPPGGTVGGALAVGRSGVRRLGYGPVRDVLLQAHYVAADGQIITAGGPTVKNVSGFDVCRLLVGWYGTLGFLGDVIVRTRPLPAHSQWHVGEADPVVVFAALHRPVSVLWDGTQVWALLEEHPTDIAEQATRAGLAPCAGPPELPSAHRWSLPPRDLAGLRAGDGFVAEIGVGIVHHTQPQPPRVVPDAVRALHRRIKLQFDPGGRLNPGVDPLDV